MIHIETAIVQQRATLANLMQLYLHDLSEYDGDLPDATGLYDLGSYFDLYWVESTRFPYVIYDGETPVGFALVREIGERVYSVAEFFVIRPKRKSNIGSQAAMQLFDKHAGTWHIAQQKENLAAQAFWKSVIRAYTNDNFKETWSDTQPAGPMQIFQTQKRENN